MRLTSAFAAPALLAAMIASASAADLRPAYKAPVAVPATHNWTGFYIGAVAGYGFGEAKAAPTILGPIGTKPRGWLAGGTIGYNYQQGNIVLGAEGEFYATGIKRSAAVVPGDYEGSFENKWTGTLAGRLGVAFDRTLVYAKLGAAVAKNDYTLWLSNTGLTQSSTEIGWLMGAGVEWALGGNWSTKLEATYMDFGQKSHALLGGQLNLNTESHIATAKIGINYKFD